MKATFLSPNDPLWMERIESDSGATIFHHPAWMQLLASCYNLSTSIFSVISEEGKLQAGIPLAVIKSILLHSRWVSLPFSDYCIPLCLDEDSRCNILQTLIDEAQQRRIRQIEIRCPASYLPFVEEHEKHLLHIVRLEPDSSQVSKRVHRQQLQNVRTAEKNNISIHSGSGLHEVKEFYRLHTLTRRRHGVPVQPWFFFRNVMNFLLTQGLGYILLAYKDHSCISAGMFLHWKNTLTYKYSATDEACLALRPNHLITWAAMQWGCEHGYTIFDFGRTDANDEGLRSYKRRWGAEETQLIYSYIPAVPGLSAEKVDRKGSIVNTFIRRSPIWVTRLLGEIAYRYYR